MLHSFQVKGDSVHSVYKRKSWHWLWPVKAWSSWELWVSQFIKQTCDRKVLFKHICFFVFLVPYKQKPKGAFVLQTISNTSKIKINPKCITNQGKETKIGVICECNITSWFRYISNYNNPNVMIQQHV